MSRSDLQRFSRVVLAISQAAEQESMEAFPLAALRAMQSELRFDAAWWGINSDRQIRSSSRLGLPDAHASEWVATKNWDPIAEEAIARPTLTSLFNADRLEGLPRKKAWLARYGIRHVMSTTYPLELLNITTFLSLYRRRDPFSSRDLVFKQQLMPHLAQGMMTNWHRHLSHLASREVLPLVGMALVDTTGLIHCANGSFAGLLRTRWPQWEGPYLPNGLVETVGASGPSDRRAAASLKVEVRQARDLMLIRLSSGSPLALLSAREQEVATAASLGKSYKEVASALGLAPATIRHYLGNAYAKLGVRNKAELTRVVSGVSLHSTGHHLTIPSVTLAPPTSVEPPRSLARRSKVS